MTTTHKHKWMYIKTIRVEKMSDGIHAIYVELYRCECGLEKEVGSMGLI